MNSPWFDLAGGWLLRGPVTAAIDVIGAVSPSVVVSGLERTTAAAFTDPALASGTMT